MELTAALQEHCLMGIKGTVRRNQDSHVIHSNVVTDIIIVEEFPFGSKRTFQQQCVPGMS